MNEAQRVALEALCDRFHAEFDESLYGPAWDLPSGWVSGWVGPIYVGCDPDGVISS